METELKFHVPPTDLERLRQHPKLAEHSVDGPREHNLTDTCYDTPGHDLWKRGPAPGAHRREEGALRRGVLP